MTDIQKTAEQCGFQFIPILPEPNPPKELIRGDFDRIVGSWGRQFQTIPIGESEGRVVIATADPLNQSAIDQLKVCYEKPVYVVATSPEEIAKAINTIRTALMSDRTGSLESSQNPEEESEDTFKIDVTDSEEEDAPIIRFVNSTIFRANAARASDVHIEPLEDLVKVRFRIDGELYDFRTESKSHQAAIASRIKVMAGMNIAEKRLPQDGRIGIKIAGRDVDLRVSTIPTQFGERIVMRLLDKTATVLDLEEIGIEGENLEVIDKLIQKPNGIILVTGPTGSGKTTTLYSCLSKINTPGNNILTVEDPIEYQLAGIGQMQVNPKIGFTFASGLRSILRQDPDIVMVGEIRDAETAEIAIQASLTGHLVLSTLHTNDAAGAVTRLIDLGVEPFLVSSSLLCAMAQRLVRKLCSDCKEEYELSDAELKELGVENLSTIKSRKAFRPGTKDCSTCNGTRYRGRTGIHEILLINDEIRPVILQRNDSNALKQAAAASYGFKTLRMDGLRKVLSGITSLEEVLLVTHEES